MSTPKPAATTPPQIAAAPDTAGGPAPNGFSANGTTVDALTKVDREVTWLGRLFVAARHRYQFEIERAHYAILLILEEYGPLPIGCIAQSLLLNNSTATRQVAAMEKLNLVERKADSGDQRIAIIRPTPHGADVMQKMRAQRVGNIGEIVKDWKEADLLKLAELMHAYNTAMIETLKEPEQEDRAGGRGRDSNLPR